MLSVSGIVGLVMRNGLALLALVAALTGCGSGTEPKAATCGDLQDDSALRADVAEAALDEVGYATEYDSTDTPFIAESLVLDSCRSDGDVPYREVVAELKRNPRE